MIGSLKVSDHGQVTFTDDQTQHRLINQTDGSTVVQNAEGRPEAVVQADGGALRFAYDDKGLSQISEIAPNAQDAGRVWQRDKKGRRVGATAEQAARNPALQGRMRVLEDGSVRIEGKSETRTWKKSGKERVFDHGSRMSRTLDREGRVLSVADQRQQACWSFGYNQIGLSKIIGSDNVRWTRQADKDVWVDRRGNEIKGKIEARDHRVVVTERDAKNNRAVAETRYSDGAKAVYQPDTNLNHQLLEQKRDELIKLGVVPKDATLGEFHEIYHQGLKMSVTALTTQLTEHRMQLNKISLTRPEQSELYNAIQKNAGRIEKNIGALDGHLKKGEHAINNPIKTAGLVALTVAFPQV